jgi:hypothetical protein
MRPRFRTLLQVCCVAALVLGEVRTTAAAPESWADPGLTVRDGLVDRRRAWRL